MIRVEKGLSRRNHYYLLSMTLIFMFFYSVLALRHSEDIYELAENMEGMKSYLSVIVWIVFVVSIKFAVDGMMQVITRYKKKLGVYALAGHTHRSLALMMTGDVIGDLMIAWIGGGLFGVLYSYGILAFLKIIFGISNISIQMLSALIAVEYLALAAVIVGINYLTAYVILQKKDVGNLLYREDFLNVEAAVYGHVNLAGNAVLAVCFFAVTAGAVFLARRYIEDQRCVFCLVGGLAAFSCFIYRITKIFLILQVECARKRPRQRFFGHLFLQEMIRNWKKFYINQCTMAALITVSCFAVSVSLTVGYSYRENISKEMPFDLAVSVDADKVNLQEVKDYIPREQVADMLEYKIYLNEELKEHGLPEQCIKLSDYNRLRGFLHREPLRLALGHYAVQVEDLSVEHKIRREAGSGEAAIRGRPYRQEGAIQNFPFLQSNINGRFALTVFNDREIESMRLPVKRTVLIVQFARRPQAKLKNELFTLVRHSSQLVTEPVQGRITIKVVLQEWTRLNGLVALSTITVFGVFLGSILLLIAVSSLARSTIKNLEKINRENGIYYDLGVEPQEINRYNGYRFRRYNRNALVILLGSGIPFTGLLFFALKNFLDHRGYVPLFGVISFGLYLVLTLGYGISVLNIVRCKKQVCFDE